MTKNLINIFLIDPHALRYFGIIRFLDMPGYFPQLTRPSLANGDGGIA